MNELIKFFQEVKSSFKKAWADASEWYLLPISSFRHAYRNRPENMSLGKTATYLLFFVWQAYKNWFRNE